MKKIILAVVLSLLLLDMYAQKGKAKDVYVDKKGVMRWGDSHEEIHAFGVNYTAPFAHAFRTAKKLHVNLEKAIDDDVYHFARLGFDAYRVHVWDCEITDTLGNLLDNEHLKLFDYTINKMKARGMKFIITPIAYWNNGYPEPDDNTPGFSAKYGKDACLVNADAIKAQERYLFQFLNHVNAYTGISYKDEPALIAFEVCNEPHHKEPPDQVTEFITRMVRAMRNTGCAKPILYNISHGIHLIDDYFKAPIQGGTFQWYPTGLGSRHELEGNFLPNVDMYKIPFADNINFKKAAKVVYEFDAADIGRSYIYPAMARSFREAGMQVATHFAYDPTFMAYANTEYGTHYMNLAYAPQKALSLKIASEVFHTVPLYKSYGRYPVNASFEDFKVSYELDLAEMLTDTKFIYTNNTESIPAKPAKLEHVAGFANSPVVQYEGKGAYFLDRVAPGVWRLEVMPDAIWVADPFTKTSLHKVVSVINWEAWPMNVNLPDLQGGFTINGLNDGNNVTIKSNAQSFVITPGSYLLTRNGVTYKVNKENQFENIRLKEFAAPATTLDKTYVLHKFDEEVVAGKPYTIRAEIISRALPGSVTVSVPGMRWRPEVIEMKRTTGYTYEAEVPAKNLKSGFFQYHITVTDADHKTYTYPSSLEGKPSDWDFYDDRSYTLKIISDATAPVYIFDAFTDSNKLSREWLATSTLIPLAEPNQAEFKLHIDKLGNNDPEDKNAHTINDYSMRYSFKNQIAGRQDDLVKMKRLTLKGRALTGKTCKLQIALVTKDGAAFGAVVMIDTTRNDYAVDLNDLKQVKLVTLPRPYPSFLPYYFDGTTTSTFNIKDVETIQFSVGSGFTNEDLNKPWGVAIESVRLE